MKDHRLAASAPAFCLIVLLLIVPSIQAAVAKPKPKPKPKAAPRRLTWKRLARNVQWQWQLDDNGSISKVRVRWNLDRLVHRHSCCSATRPEMLCSSRLLPVVFK